MPLPTSPEQATEMVVLSKALDCGGGGGGGAWHNG